VKPGGRINVFDIGDRVRFAAPQHSVGRGQEGTVSKVLRGDGNYAYKVKMEGYGEVFALERELERVEEQH